jgi:hypothetical protein
LTVKSSTAASGAVNKGAILELPEKKADRLKRSEAKWIKITYLFFLRSGGVHGGVV